jgi:outer membrane autotransporter protein
VRSSVVAGLFGVALIGAPQHARAQCTTNPTNGGVAQNGGAPCTVSTPVTVGFGTAVSTTNNANVTTNAAVTAHGFGTGISADTNSLVTVNGPVTASGAGLNATNGAQIIANSILLQNDGGGGAVAMIANNATIVANGITIVWPNGAGQSLVQALAGGVIQFTPNSSLTIPGGGVPSALLASGSGSQIIADTLSLSMGGSGGITAAKAQLGGNIQLTGGSITFSGGGGNTGLSATGTNSAITANGVSISVGNGGGDVGANADTGGSVALTGGNVSVQGVGGGETGLRATGAGSLITASNVAINVTGSGGNAGLNAANGASIVTTDGSVSVVNGAGGLLQNGGNVTMAGTNVTASGNGGFGFLFNNGGSANTLQYSNGTITASSASFSVQGATANINLSNTIATANNNTLLETKSSGTTLFNVQQSTLQGVISTENGSTSTVNLTQGTVWTMTGNSTATNVTNDSSQIIYTAPTGDPTQLSSYKTLTVSNYIGVGGLIGLNTFLGTDSSPSDKLVISGGSGSGSTAIRVTNAGGPGAPTVSDGILLVQAINGATTTPTAFSLARPVTAGAFDYFLFRGGVSPGSQDSWFLRSSLVGPPIPPLTPGQSPTPTPAPGQPPLPTAVPGAPPIPLFQPDVALKSVVPSLARTVGLVTLGTFNERQGDQLLLRGDMRVGVWGRVFGQETREHFAQGAQPDFDGTVAGFQAGADLWRLESINGHSDHIGFYVGQARASGSVHGLVDAFQGAPAGHVDLDATSYGGYWTHLGRSNWYIDAVLQGTHFQTSENSIRGDSSNFGGRGFAASLEAGYPIALTSWLRFEPQIQGIWQRTSFDNTLDSSSTIAFDRSDVATGRAGALLRGTFGRIGTQWQPYLKGNIWWGSNGVDTATFNGFGITTGRNGGTTLEGGGGVTGKVTRNVGVYADASYLSSVSGETRITLKGNAGLRVTW